ncbi:luciferase family protein [Halosegnis marinus]|uniref:Luciferase family protein n=1 Tax=Halosegnis marinus TaxID=3034023 RepID=A0ABD5ZPY4_9EURY|nr:luciferase family protein [Halosegnis sp. DT85]
MAIAQSVEQAIVSRASEWDGVTTATRRGGRVEFVYDGEDIGHIDDDGSLDLPLSIPVREALVAAGRTHAHPTYPKTGWTTFDIRGQDDVEEAVRLLRLAYVYYVLEASNDDGRAALADSIALDAEMAAFDASDDLREAMAAVAR